MLKKPNRMGHHQMLELQCKEFQDSNVWTWLWVKGSETRERRREQESLSCCVPLLSAQDHDCPSSFHCGHFGVMYFPFTNTTNPECGLYLSGCDDPAGSAVELRLENEHMTKTTWLQVDSIVTFFPTSTMLVHDTSLEKFLYQEGTSEDFRKYLHNVTLPPPSPLMSFEKEFNQTKTLHACDGAVDASFNHSYCNDLILYDGFRTPSNQCTTFQIPFIQSDSINYSVTTEFTIKVTLSEDCRNCMYQRGGRCGLDHRGMFHCIFQEHRYEFLTVLKMATASSAALVAMLMILRCCLARPPACIFFWKGENLTEKKIEMFLKRHELQINKRYTYSEIREMTNCFKDKLGKGGFGSVYKGKLPDGRLLEVKVLNKLKGNGEEFINEVASISQTSHVNVVSLYGFCFQGSKRALVYEFMPNGSLEKFIYEDNAAKVDRQLDCKTLHDIAIGTARGLEYLHRGCNTRILHFDIKPHNILLDVDFCPKISDFGLAKICPRKESIVSMLVARGTAGYIAPEVFSRNFGGVSHKSDVYSFGMMVLEMVGGRKNINVEVECSSEIYFPHWIYKSLEKNQELALRCIKNENDNEMVRKMILVSLWCIQTDPSARPAMSQVVDMLEGSVESLQIPPKPFLSSPRASPTHYSTSTLSQPVSL